MLLGIEAILTEKAYAGKAKYIIDSPKPKSGYDTGKIRVNLKFESEEQVVGLD